MPNDFSFEPEGGRLADFGGDLFTGVVSGLREDPFLKPIVDRVAAAGGFSPEQLDSMASSLSTVGKIGAFAGEYGPLFAGTLGAFNLSRKAAGLALEAAQVTGLAQKVGTGIAGAVGEGAFFGGREFLKSGDKDEAVRQALVGGAFSAGGQLVAAGLGRVLTGPNITEPLRRRFESENLAKTAPIFRAEIEAIERKGGEAAARISDALGINASFDSLTRTGVDDLLGRNTVMQRIINNVAGRSRVPARLRPQEIFEEAERITTSVQKDLSGLKSLALDKNTLRGFLDADPTNWYMGLRAQDPADLRLILAKARVQLSSTPEGFLRRNMGVTGNNFISQVSRLEGSFDAGRLKIEADLTRNFRAEMSKYLGLSGRAGSKKNRPIWAELFNRYRHGGSPAVRDFALSRGRNLDDANKLAAKFDGPGGLGEWLDDLYPDLARIGGAPAEITADELAEAGHAAFLPVMFKNLQKSKLHGLLAAQPEFGLSGATDLMQVIQKSGLGRTGSRNLWRVFTQLRPGQREALLRSGVLEDDPWSALYRDQVDTLHRSLYGRAFGFTGEQQDRIRRALREAVQAEAVGRPDTVSESGAASLMDTLFDAVVNRPYYDGGMKKLSDIALSSEIASKLTFAFIPNATQSINTGLMFGFRRTLRAASHAINKGHNPDRSVLESAGLMNQLMSGIGREFETETLERASTGIRSLDLFGNAADTMSAGMLRYTGFSLVERWNRIIAGQTGLFYLRDAASKHLAGRLRGATLDFHRRTFRRLGLDLDEYVGAVRSRNRQAVFELEKRGAYRAARETQFIPTQSRKPVFWNTPTGRVMFQFKNFALGQARFLRDQVLGEASRGNMEPLSYWLALYPLAGEVVGDVRSILKSKDRESVGVERLLEDYLAVGGLGLATDALTSAQFGRLMEFIAGPAVSDATNVAQEMLQGDHAGLLGLVGRQPIVQATGQFLRANVLTSELAIEHVQRQLEEVSLDEIRLEATQRK